MSQRLSFVSILTFAWLWACAADEERAASSLTTDGGGPSTREDARVAEPEDAMDAKDAGASPPASADAEVPPERGSGGAGGLDASAMDGGDPPDPPDQPDAPGQQDPPDAGVSEPPPDAAVATADAGPPPPPPVDPDATTYHAHVRPLLERYCLDCHVAGGIGPFPLDTFEAVEPYAPLVVSAVTSGRMPPWPAREDCHPLRDARTLTGAERALFSAWLDDGRPEGDPATYAPLPTPPARVAGEPNVRMDPGESYVPDVTLDDEYRCFLLEGTFAEDTFVTAMDIIPGVREQVHHVQTHVFPASSRGSAIANDNASAGVGYSCFGGVGVPEAVNMFSWRPGASAIAFEPGDAGFIAAGSGVVIQVHYNNQFIPAGQSPAPDLTEIAFWTLADGSLPDRIITRAATTAGIDIPAGDSAVLSQATIGMPRISTVGGGFLGLGGTYLDGEIVGMTPHMHNLGTRLSSELIRADGSRACMVDVPDWSFEWQLDYLFSEPVPFAAGDSLTVRCEYDNSPQNQPVINGQRVTPRNVTWGEGSLDEMCLNYVWVRYPRDAFLSALR